MHEFRVETAFFSSSAAPLMGRNEVVEVVFVVIEIWRVEGFWRLLRPMGRLWRAMQRWSM
jgi:hypothetical protein